MKEERKKQLKEAADGAAVMGVLKKVKNKGLSSLSNEERIIYQECVGEKKKYSKETIYDSLQQASEIMDIDINILRSAKKKGCPAFKNSRVYKESLEKWMDENPDFLLNEVDSESIETKKKRFMDRQIERLTFQNKIMKGEYWGSEEVKFCVAEAMANAIDIVRKFLSADVYNAYVREINAANSLIVERMDKRIVEDALRGDGDGVGKRETDTTKLDTGTTI